MSDHALTQPVTVTPEAIALAQRLHDIYERRALDEYGYLPRTWERLTETDQNMKAASVQELLDGGLVVFLPNCTHPFTTLKRVEMRVCDVCGTPYSLLNKIARDHYEA